MSRAWMEPVLHATGFGLGCILWIRAAAHLPARARLERGLEAVLVLFWAAVVLFYLLAASGLFVPRIAVVLMLVSGLALQPIARRKSATFGASDPALAAPRLRDPWLWSAAPILVLAAARLVKGMTAPPMTRDAMTMHLPKPAFWIQSSSLALPDFPDAWAYYRWFPAAGEALFAWLMGLTRDDLLLGPFGVLTWLLIWVAGARLARVLGAGRQMAWLAGGALASLPAISVFTTANYVDNLVILFVLFAITHGLLFRRAPSTVHAVLSLGAAGLAIGAKTSALAVLAPLIATTVWLTWRQRARLHWWALPMSATALLAPCFGYFHTWIHTGSPIYPFRAPLVRLPFHQGLADLFAGRVMIPEGSTGSLGEVVSELFWSPPFGLGHMNFGVGGALLAAAAIGGLTYAVRDRDKRFALWLTLAGAAVSTPLVFTESNLALRTLWVTVLGRHLLAAFAPVLLWAALAPSRLARIALASSLIAGTLHQAQLGWSSAMYRPALLIGLSLIAALAAGTALERWKLRRPSVGVREALAVALVAVFVWTWWTVRADARYEIYRQANFKEGAFDAHPGHPAFPMGASLWPLLDTERELVIAVTVGKDQVGHNQFFYPLLGSSFQNRLTYVPVTRSGNDDELEPAERYARADPELWLDRLGEASADLVVGLWQATPEREWLARHGDYEIIALTNLGVPWIGRHRDSPPILPEAPR
ncbi:MAG: hypothetical protein ACE5GX_09710 [Thermoanaerobaculia bacterium]